MADRETYSTALFSPSWSNFSPEGKVFLVAAGGCDAGAVEAFLEVSSSLVGCLPDRQGHFTIACNLAQFYGYVSPAFVAFWWKGQDAASQLATTAGG
jgi:hypothetical protein